MTSAQQTSAVVLLDPTNPSYYKSLDSYQNCEVPLTWQASYPLPMVHKETRKPRSSAVSVDQVTISVDITPRTGHVTFRIANCGGSLTGVGIAETGPSLPVLCVPIANYK
jgi:hypothetical protein